MNGAAGRPTLFLIAGPNGAGKTTFYETVLKTRVAAPFINADVIQRDELQDLAADAAYEAARIAAERRAELIEARRSFLTETVFSHDSKLDMLEAARKAGFRIVVFHLHLTSSRLAIARVRARVKEGGHSVPDHKVSDRYERNQTLIRTAVLAADEAMVYDASGLNEAPRLMMKMRAGRVEYLNSAPPPWFTKLYGGG